MNYWKTWKRESTWERKPASFCPKVSPYLKKAHPRRIWMRRTSWRRKHKFMDSGMIKPIIIEEEMKNSYLDYAMSVIVSRALPDVRDGLKPVHRRILYAMQELGLRYTEAKLARIADEMLVDIDKDTVDFVPNFDDSLKEPSVLPAKLPNLLVNGSSGIAVGMAPNIPPHNLSEVWDAISYFIDNTEA